MPSRRLKGATRSTKSAFQNLVRAMWCEREADGVLRWFPSIRLHARQPQIPERGF